MLNLSVRRYQGDLSMDHLSVHPPPDGERFTVGRVEVGG